MDLKKKPGTAPFMHRGKDGIEKLLSIFLSAIGASVMTSLLQVTSRRNWEARGAEICSVFNLTGSGANQDSSGPS